MPYRAVLPVTYHYGMGTHLFNIRFPHDVWEGVKSAAESERRSVHQWVLLAVEEALRWGVPVGDPVTATYSDGSRVVSVPDGEPMGMEVRKAPPVELAEWDGTLATVGGVTVDLESSPELKPLFESGKVQRGSSGVRKRAAGVCPHRVPAGVFCKRCGA